MSGADLDAMSRALEDLRGIKIFLPVEPNFFEIGGAGYLESPTSDLMALFMGLQARHVPPWLAKALVACLVDQGQADKDFEMDWDNIAVEREASISGENGNAKFLDILVCDGINVIGIENKVFADSSYNPFADYARLLDKRSSGGKILKCILQSYPRVDGLIRDWPIVTYAELADKALERYGRDVLNKQQSKWQHYYQEFLYHLKELSSQHMTKKLDAQSTEFVVKNFDMLKKASRLIDAFESDLSRHASEVISKALSARIGREIFIKTKHTTSYDGKMKELSFYPNSWGGDSCVVIYYYEGSLFDSEDAIGFGACVNISEKTAKHPLKDIEKAFMAASAKGQLPSTFQAEEEISGYYRDRSILWLDTFPTDSTRIGVIQAAKDLALWVQQYAFE